MSWCLRNLNPINILVTTSNKSLLLSSVEVHVSLADGGLCVMGHLCIVVVDPPRGVVLLPRVAHVVTGVDTRTQVSDEALHLEGAAALTRIASSERLVVVGGCRRVDLHWLVCTVWIIHMTHNEVTCALKVTIALAKGSRRLLIREAHACEHHEGLRVGDEAARATSGSTLLRVRNHEWSLHNWVLDVTVEPHDGFIGAGTSIVDSMLSSQLGHSIRDELVNHVHIDLGLHHVGFLSLRETNFAFFELAGAPTESGEVQRSLMVGLKGNIKLLWDPLVEDDPLEANSEGPWVRNEAFPVRDISLCVALGALESFYDLIGKSGLEARIQSHGSTSLCTRGHRNRQKEALVSHAIVLDHLAALTLQPLLKLVRERIGWINSCIALLLAQKKLLKDV